MATEKLYIGVGLAKGEGLYFCEFQNGTIRVINKLPLRNPSYLCVNEACHRIYAVNELKEFEGNFGGGISEIAYDSQGGLRLERSLCTGGTDPCHVALSPDGRYLVVSNFASGSVSVFPLEANGALDGTRRLFQHIGNSVHPIRQRGPHAHSAIFSPDGSFLVPDLGLDRLIRYAPYGERQVDSIQLAPGSGPRFGEFSPDRTHFYLINELASSVTCFSCGDGTFQEQETVSTLPEDYTGENICSDLHISPNGRFLYASNRGHDSICVFSIDGGPLIFLERVPCGGRTPRAFSLDTTGQYLLAGNQDSDSISVFRVGENGRLSHVHSTAFPTPVCLCFLREFGNTDQPAQKEIAEEMQPNESIYGLSRQEEFFL